MADNYFTEDRTERIRILLSLAVGIVYPLFTGSWLGVGIGVLLCLVLQVEVSRVKSVCMDKSNSQ